MRRSIITQALVPAALLALSGAAWGQANQDAMRQGDQQRASQRDRHENMKDDRRAEATVSRAEKIIGAEVRNNENQKIGKIDDLIVDPQRGAVGYAILSHGGFLGIGDKLIAIPWQSVDWNEATRVAHFDATKEKLEGAPNFDPAKWPELNDRAWFNSAAAYFGADPNWADSKSGGWGRESMYQKHYNPSEITTLTGKVLDAHPMYPTTGMAEGRGVIISGDDNRQHVVHLGPTWYVQTQDLGLQKGDQVVIHGSLWTMGGEQVLIARDVEVNNQAYRFRDDQGTPYWDARRTEAANAGSTNAKNMEMHGPYARASKLKGADVINEDKRKIGDVSDIFVDGGGRIPFAVLSVGGFLGMGDALVPVPWKNLKCLEDGKLMASGLDKEKLTNAPRLEKDWSLLSDRAFADRINQYFGALPADASAWADVHGTASKGWAAGSEYNRKFASGKSVSLEGTVTKVEHVAPMQGMADALIITVSTDQGDRVVQLGPAWYLNMQELTINPNDRVKINGKEVSIDGQTVVMAADIHERGDTLTLRDRDGTPRWSPNQRKALSNADENRNR